MAYRVKAALATYRVAGQLLYGYEGAVVPAGVEKAEVEHLLDAGLIEKVEDEAKADSDDRPAKVDDILKDVGDDKAKAAEALATEEARGDAARPTLVAKLKAIADGS